MKTRTDKKIDELIAKNNYNLELYNLKDIKGIINSIDDNVYKNFYSYDNEIYTSMIYFYDTTKDAYTELRISAIGKTENESVENVIKVLEEYASKTNNDNIEIITISSIKEGLNNHCMDSFLKKMNNDSVYVRECA
tara:strand:+ start:3637 stop:4044 length:408 start_codon:yes stop_codon:yes gene_type:complete